jgi:hypothetical protein
MDCFEILPIEKGPEFEELLVGPLSPGTRAHFKISNSSENATIHVVVGVGSTRGPVDLPIAYRLELRVWVCGIASQPAEEAWTA